MKTGAKYGPWTIIGKAKRQDNEQRRYTCRCTCGLIEDRHETTLYRRLIDRCIHGSTEDQQRDARKRSRRRREIRERTAALRERLARVATPKRLERILSRKALTTRQLMTELGLVYDNSAATFAPGMLAERGAKKRCGVGQAIWFWPAAEVEKLPRIGPALAAGEGQKRDCARWDSCLTRFAREEPRAVDAHCPSSCAYFLPIERSRLLRKACEDVSYAQRGANFGGAG